MKIIAIAAVTAGGKTTVVDGNQELETIVDKILQVVSSDIH